MAEILERQPPPDSSGHKSANNLSEPLQSVDLRAHFRICRRVVIRKSIRWLIALGFLTVFCFVVLLNASHAQNDSEMLSLAREAFIFLSLISLCVFMLKLLYESLYRLSYRYEVEAGHLIVSKGVILKQRGSFPLSRITDVYLDRTLGDFLFGLCSLHVSTPTIHSGEFARIEGLNHATAVALQELLTNLLETYRPESDGRSKAKSNGTINTLNRTSPPLFVEDVESDTSLH